MHTVGVGAGKTLPDAREGRVAPYGQDAAEAAMERVEIEVLDRFRVEIATGQACPAPEFDFQELKSAILDTLEDTPPKHRRKLAFSLTLKFQLFNDLTQLFTM